MNTEQQTLEGYDLFQKLFKKFQAVKPPKNRESGNMLEINHSVRQFLPELLSLSMNELSILKEYATVHQRRFQQIATGGIFHKLVGPGGIIVGSITMLNTPAMPSLIFALGLAGSSLAAGWAIGEFRIWWHGISIFEFSNFIDLAIAEKKRSPDAVIR